VAIINKNIYGEDGEDGLIALYVDDYVRQPILVQGQVVIRDSYAVNEVKEEKDDEMWDDMDDNDNDDYNKEYYEDHNTE
jgi:hypothetical protein